VLLTLVLMIPAALVGAALAYRRPTDFLLFAMAAGILRFGADAEGLYVQDLSAIWLGILCVLTLVALVRLKASAVALALPEKVYLFFLMWCVFEALRAEVPTYAIRSFLKLLYPFMILMLARRSRLTENKARFSITLLMGVAFAASLAIGTVTVKFMPFISSLAWDLTWPGAPFADYAAIMGMIALGCWRAYRQPKYFILAMWLAGHSVLGSIRTGVLAFAVGVGMFCIVEFKKRAVPFLIVVYVLAGSIFLMVPEISQKMFRGRVDVDVPEMLMRPGDIATENINDDGRFTMWRVVMDAFFWPDPALGSGLGATQNYFYSLPMGSIRIEHSEYVKLLCDTGVIGCALYVLTLLACMREAWKVLKRSNSPSIRVLAIGVLAGVPAFMTCMAFDNVLLYVLVAAQYPFAFTGAVLSLEQHHKKIKQLERAATYHREVEDETSKESAVPAAL
jgi:O-antigen ligase